MARSEWHEHVRELAHLLESLSCRGVKGRNIPAQKGFDRWAALTFRVRRARRTIFLVGNGASASMASHMASDLAKNAGLRTEVFSDPSMLTAIANDIGYEHVFSEPLSRRGAAGDMLVAISSSGRSPNVLAAVETAGRLGLTIVTLSAMDERNPLRASGAMNMYVPARSYGHAESCHAAILHHWMDMVEYRRTRRSIGMK